MEGLQEDGNPLKKEQSQDEFYWLHHLFRLHGIPIHESYRWSEEEKLIAFSSLQLQLQQERERNQGIGRVM